MRYNNDTPVSYHGSSKVLKEISDGLVENLGWLDKSFYRAERIVRRVNERNYIVPAFYSGTSISPNDYIQLLPDSHLGNFSFFYPMDPETHIAISHNRAKFRLPFALIFWFDLRTVWDSTCIRDTESLKKDIMDLLNSGIRVHNGNITVTEIYTQPDNIYREFNLDEIDNQFLMHPFAGFRFEGYIEYLEEC